MIKLEDNNGPYKLIKERSEEPSKKYKTEGIEEGKVIKLIIIKYRCLSL
jgi:hypothetical protein